MYKRKETVEEESIDWKKHPVSPFVKKDTKITKAVGFPVSELNKTSLYETIGLEEKSNIKRKVMDLSDANSKLFLISSILVFPYIIGFLVSYFLFYFYSAMAIGRFFGLQQGYRHIELWGIGAYMFVTVGIIWIIFKNLLKK